MMMRESIIFAGALLLSGCFGGSGGGTATSETGGLFDNLQPKDVDLQGMAVTQNAKPQVANVEPQMVSKSDNQAVMPAAAPAVVAANVDDVATQEVSSGENITVTIAYNAKQAYPDGLVFQIQLIEKPDHDGPGKVWNIDGGSVTDVPAGPGNLEVEAFLPYDIPTGDYVLLGSVLEETQVDPETYDINKDLGVAKLPLKVVQADHPDMEISALSFSTDYLGMSQHPEFAEGGFTIEPNISGAVDVFNAGGTEREAELELVWETSNGKSGRLALVDEMDGTISDTLKIVIPPTEEEGYIVPLNGFLSSTDYQLLLPDAPDLGTSAAEIPRLKITARLSDPQNSSGDGEEDNAVSENLAFLLDESLDLFHEEDYTASDPGVETVGEVQTKSSIMASQITEKSAISPELQNMLKRIVNGEPLGKTWNPVWGRSDRFAIKPSFKYEVKLAMNPWPQATADAAAGVNVVALNTFNLELTKLEANGILSALPIGNNTAASTTKRRYGGALSFKFLGAKMVDENDIANEDVTPIATSEFGDPAGGDSTGGDSTGGENPQEKAITSKTVVAAKDKAATYKKKVGVGKKGTTFNKTWETDRTLGTARFFVGPVPLSISGGVKGSLGVGATFAVVGLALDAKAVAPVKLDGYVRGGVDLVAVSAGVNGTINMLDLGAVGAGKFGLDAWTDEGSSDLNIGIGMKSAAFIGNAKAGDVDPYDNAARKESKLSAIKASVNLYANASVPKICWIPETWITPSIPYPCGFATEKYNFDFYRSPWLFEKNVPIFEWSKQIELFRLDTNNLVMPSI